jgi:putative PIN family toxin of toxin-antitoxin system
MRVVLDTNILVSYILTQGKTLSRIIDHWERGSFVVLTSPALLAELKDVLQRPRLRPYMSADPQVLLHVLEHDAHQVPGELILTGVCRDSKDDIFIACAVEGGANFLVSGDDDLLVLDNYQGIQMVSPSTFLQLLDQLEE